MTNICESCQLCSPTAGCTKLKNESCLKEALKNVKPSVTNGEVMQKMFPNAKVIIDGTTVCLKFEYYHEIWFDLDWWNAKWGE